MLPSPSGFIARLLCAQCFPKNVQETHRSRHAPARIFRGRLLADSKQRGRFFPAFEITA